MNYLQRMITSLKNNKRYWLTPVVLILVLLILLLVFTDNSAVPTFLYTRF